MQENQKKSARQGKKTFFEKKDEKMKKLQPLLFNIF